MKRNQYLKYLMLLIPIALLLFFFIPRDNVVPTVSVPEDGAASVTETESIPQTEIQTEPSVPKKRVAITYDDGPAFDNDTSQRLTYKIVDEFQEYGGTATFFVLGNRINSTTGQAIQYAHERGFEFGIHAYTHEIYFDTCSEKA